MKPSEIDEQLQELVGGTVTNIDYNYYSYMFSITVLTDDGAETYVWVTSDGYDDGIEVHI